MLGLGPWTAPKNRKSCIQPLIVAPPVPASLAASVSVSPGMFSVASALPASPWFSPIDPSTASLCLNWSLCKSWISSTLVCRFWRHLSSFLGPALTLLILLPEISVCAFLLWTSRHRICLLKEDLQDFHGNSLLIHLLGMNGVLFQLEVS